MPVSVLLALLVQASPAPMGHARSVYHISAKVDAPVMIGAALVFAVPYAYENTWITLRCPCDPREVNAFDRPAIGNTSAAAKTLSDVTAISAVVAPAVVDVLKLGKSRALFEDAVVFGQTMLVNTALVTAAKFIVQRPLPRTYAGDSTMIHSPEGYRSFYSGHTSTVFAALAASAMTLRWRYGEKTWPWILTGVVGTSVAIERVADGRHFPTDVMTAAVMGTAVGIAVPALHHRQTGRVLGPAVLPAPGGGTGFGVAIRF
jgi:membrane-associated phospholipid phosphatase